ncbi:lipocalin-like domain-containing protein [Rufibacter aurantiacus]|uniref:lipocalin-like domain-containing protein n=1 Tax=Rufibacter aurantiacus TaxID=2817374 RepID=UPI001B301C32|nr:lipocalin-like domain-containing protein [Rufibacter aurantiacus]
MKVIICFSVLMNYKEANRITMSSIKAISSISCLIALLLIIGCNNTKTEQTNQSEDPTTSKSPALVGTWEVVSAKLYEQGEQERGGAGKDFYGLNPKGHLMFDENGNYMLTVLRSDIPRFQNAQGNDLGREQGTDEQNRRAVHGSIANFGTYEINIDTLILHIEKATYPNWDGLVQRRPFRIAGDSLIYRVPEASSGGGTTAEFVWKRISKVYRNRRG